MALVDLLQSKSIDISKWGKGIFKSVDNLFDEIRKSDCILTDEPTRIISIAVIKIIRENNILIEQSQKMRNGIFRLRNKLPREKIKIGESIKHAAIRCLNEELNISNNDFRILSIKEEPKVFLKESDSYPELITKYNQYDVSVQAKSLPLNDFSTNEKGEEHDPVEIHFWRWVPLNQITNLK